MKRFAGMWTSKPLSVILLVALALRLIAVVFSQGYGVHNDHFMVIETAQAWVDGTSYQKWLPVEKDFAAGKPIGHSFTYVGIHYFLFQTFEACGIMNAHTKMFVIRLLHALFSLLVVNYAYRITHMVSNKDMARYVGLLTATFWLLPFVSVHNLAEYFAVPFLMMATWFLLRPQYRDKPHKWAFFSGLLLGVGFSMWFFIFIFVIGFMLSLSYQRKWQTTFLVLLGFLVSASIFQGIVDFLIWNQPFAEFFTFLQNLEIPFTKPHRTIFSMYLLLLVLVMIPPVSIFWLAGWLQSSRKNLLLFLPTFLMVLYFSFSIQQHERFIMAVFPFILIAGVVGWNQILQKSVFWNNHPALYRNIIIFFWVINFTLLFPVSTMYSKKAQVRSMLYLQKYKDEIEQVLIEDSNRGYVRSMPLFYLEKWIRMYKLPKYKEYADIALERKARWEYTLSTPRYFQTDSAHDPDFVLFVGRKRLDERVQRLKPFLPNLVYHETIDAGIIDRLLYELNPTQNINQSIYIYEVESL